MGEFINQPSMSAGEISPSLYGRVDQELYYIGLRTCVNFIVRQYGGAANAPGTKFIAEVKDSSKKVRLIPFQFNEEQTYVLAIGDEYMRVIKDGGEVLQTEKTITNVLRANPARITCNAHGYSNGDDVYISGIEGMVELNGRTFRVANKTTNDFEITDFQGNNIDSTDYSIYLSGGTAERVYTLTTPWVEADLFNLNYAQSNDILTVVHNDYYPSDVSRTDHDAWSVADFENSEGPFQDINVSATTVYSDAATGSVTITASTGIFDADMVGELFYIEQHPNDATKVWETAKSISSGDKRRAGAHYYEAKNTATTGTVRPDHTEGKAYDGDNGVQWEYLHSGFGVVRFTGFTSSTVMTGTVVKRLPENAVGSGNATQNWAKAAWSLSQGYPGAVTYHEQRLIFGGTAEQPNGVWMSGTALRTFFGSSFPIQDDETITLKLNSRQANTIRHLMDLSELVVLTSSSEQAIDSIDGVFLATTPPTATTRSYNGSSRVIPIIIGTSALYVQDIGSVVRSLEYKQDVSTGNISFTGLDLTARSSHLFENKTIVDWSYQRHPFSCLWVVMDDGALYGFTYMEEQKVYAWHRHETDGLYESVCCIREGRETATYFVVKRTINGVTKRYIERMQSRLFDGEIEDAFFVHSGLTYDGRNTSATTITITGGTTWDTPEELTLTASAATFRSTDIGDRIDFKYTDSDGNERLLKLTISAFTSNTVVTAIPDHPVPTSYRSSAKTDWRFARNVFRPLHHIEGAEVSVLADGNVIEGITVEDGAVVLPSAAAVVHIGLPYTAQIETLDMAQPQGQGKAKTLNIPRVFVHVQESRGLKVGIDGFTSMEEVPEREEGSSYDASIAPATKVFEVSTNSNWAKTGRICIEQDQPLPITILCITPEVVIGYS